MTRKQQKTANILPHETNHKVKLTEFIREKKLKKIKSEREKKKKLGLCS